MVTEPLVTESVVNNTPYELSVIILCFNHLEYTKKCIESVLLNTNNKNYNIIIVNNASTDETLEYLNHISLNNNLISVIHNTSNLGFSKGMNIGVKTTTSEYIILLNNDTIVNKNWDIELLNILEENADVYAVTPITNSSGNESCVYVEHTDALDFFDQISKIQSTLLSNFQSSSLALFCGAFRRRNFIELDYLDENYINGWEDDDLYEKINKIKKKVIVTSQSVVYHYGSVTVGNLAYSNNDNNPNKLYFENKWNKLWSSKRCNNIMTYPREPSPKNIRIYKYICITGNDDGGSYFWALHYYKYFKLIKNQKDFKDIIITDKTSIILNSFLLSNITLDFLQDIKNKTNCKILVPIHDYYWFCDNIHYLYDITIHSIYIDKNRKHLPHMIQLYKLADKFLVSTQTILNNIKHLIPNNYLDKFFISSETWSINLELSNKCSINENNITDSINIGVFIIIDECKGVEQVNYLKTNFKFYNYKKINFYIVGQNIPFYKNTYESFIQHVNRYQIHSFLLLNKYGETWCYTLDKILISGLPLFYNNIGVFKDRIIPDKTRYCINCNDESEYYDFNKLKNNFINFLNVIQSNTTQTKKNINIKKFAVYFPQFHTIKENNISFYNEYNDIKNLNICPEALYAINEISYSKDTPNLNMLKLKSTDEYNLLNDDLIDNQVTILKEYNFTGLAVYYYWFSENSITNKNLIMFDVIEKILNKTINVFFIWANENWTDNVAFTQKNSKHTIKNNYNEDEIRKHCIFLATCFKHPNYYKIQNKPVFYIHHPWFFDNLDLFEQILNQQCIGNGFNGVHLKINDMNTDITTIKDNKNHYYSFHPNYKKSTLGIVLNQPSCAAYLDYTDYVNKLSFVTNVQCIFFDFDNYARLVKPNKIKHRTKCINNSVCNHIKYMNKISDYYQSIENDDSDPFILLFNAFNEWGEKMHIEPSEKYNTYYLDLINTVFKKPNTETNTNTNTKTNTKTNTDTKTNTKTNTDTNTDTNIDTETNTETNKPKTLIGKNNILFLINDTNKELEIHCNNLLKVYDLELSRFTFKNYYLFVYPDKSVVYKDFLPEPYVCKYRPALDLYKQKLKNVYDLYEILKNENDVYYKTDTHINIKGNYMVYKFFISIINTILNLNIQPKELIIYCKQCILKNLPYGLGDLTWPKNLGIQYYGDLNDLFYFNNEVTWFLNQYIIQNDNNSIRFLTHVLEDTTYSLHNETVNWDIISKFIIYVKNINKIPLKVIIFYGSSLAHILPLYFEIFNEIYFVKSEYSNNLINLIDPNYVFDFTIERFLR